MWNTITDFILRNRLLLFIFILLLTAIMGFYASKVELGYDYKGALPPNDPEQLYFNEFRKQFGEDGNVIAIGMKDSAIFDVGNFQHFRELNEAVRKLDGVNEVLSLPMVKIIQKDTANRKFRLQSVFPEKIPSQQAMDSLMAQVRNQPFYMGRIVNPANGALMMIISVQKEAINSERRLILTKNITELGSSFSEKTGIELRYAGLPFIRSVVSLQVRREMSIFLYLSAIITGVIMFLFFRSFRAVLFSMVMIGIVVVWTLGTLALFGYKITLLSGLIPPVIVTIGITNAIYLLNKYHVEFEKSKDKELAIRTVIQRMGLATFLTNLTVAIGFLSLMSTDITVLREFGIVAGINIMNLFIVSLVMMPGLFVWMPNPTEKHLRHLQFKFLGGIVQFFNLLVQRQRPLIYVGVLAITAISVVGILKLRSVSFMVDDIPEESQVKKDLTFFENHFSGIMPLEFMVDTGKKRGVLDVSNLKKIDAFESFLDSLPHVSRPLSFVSFVKASKQAFYNNNPEKYTLPDKREGGFIVRYMKGQTDNTGLFKSFVDSSFQKMRISCQMADIGSAKMDSLVHLVIEPRMKSDFEGSGIKNIQVTGSTKLFIKGNKFLVANLWESLIIAFVLITLSMVILFANVRMIIISLAPNVIALMITAGIMGFLNIPLKPSTALIFSITFGISVDNSIRFLAKYRQEQLANNFFVFRSVTESILETGKSIMYTSIVLFAGFIIFAFSSFGGTIALGILTSTTLVISMFTNLILLPALILTFDTSGKKRGHQVIDDFDSSFYGEGDNATGQADKKDPSKKTPLAD